MTHSAAVARNIATLRRMQKVSARVLAERVTALGYEVSRGQIANYETERALNLPLEFVVYAAEALHTSLFSLLADTVRCPTCAGKPPIGFTCNLCGAGELPSEAAL